MPQKSHSPTLREIAKELGVSHVTVSLALRHDPSISEATRKKVHRAAKKMGYRPDPEVAKLMNRLRQDRTDRSSTVMAFLDVVQDHEPSLKYRSYTELLLKGARHQAEALGYKFESFVTPLTGNGPSLKKILYQRNIRSVLIPPLPEGACTMDLDWDHLAAVAMTHTLREPKLIRVCPHQSLNMQILFQKVISLGYRRPGLVLASSMDRRVSHSWRGSYLAMCEDYPDAQGVPVLRTSGDEAEALPKWINTYQPDMVISAHIEFREILEQHRFRIPQDLGFCCLVSEGCGTETAHMDQNPEVIGKVAATQAAGMLQTNQFGIPAHPQATLVEGIWRDGPSLPKINC